MIPEKIHLIYGNNDFLIEKRIYNIKLNLLGEDINSLNFEKIKNANMDYVYMAVNAVPMISGVKLICIYDFTLLKERSKEEGLLESKFLESIEDLQPNIHLIFSYIGKPDKRLKFVKELSKFARLEEYNNFSVWDDREIIEWIIKEVNDRGYEIESDLALKFKESVGSNDLRNIIQEIEKIITYIGNTKKNITEEDILKVSAISEASSFKLMNTIREVKLDESSYLIFRMLKEGEDPVRLLNFIVNQLRFLLILKLNSNLSLEEVSIKMGKYNMSKNTYYLKKCLGFIKGISLNKLKMSYGLAQETDFFIKTGQMKPRVALENFTNEAFIS